MFILIKPIVLELIELLVIAVNLLLKSVKSFFKYAHLQGEIIKNLCGHCGFCIWSGALFQCLEAVFKASGP